MTSVEPVDPNRSFADQLAASSPDRLRDMLSTFIQSLMSAAADAVCGAGYGERRPERVNSRNGYRHRDFDTRVGTIWLLKTGLAAGERITHKPPSPRRTATPLWVSDVLPGSVRGPDRRPRSGPRCVVLGRVAP
jgi:hypothetical protein